MNANGGDAAARELIRNALDDNMVVEAAAGTGKTSELVRRIVAVLASGRAHVDSLVAVTFTEKAAGELKLRLRAAIEQARQLESSAPARANLERALAQLEQARIGTIHGFCADLLRERPVEARVDPQLRVLTEAEAWRLYERVFDRWLEQQREAPSEGVRRSLRRRAQGDDSPAGRLRAAGWRLCEFRDFPARWQRRPFARDAEVDALVAHLHAFAEISREPAARSDPLYRETEAARRLYGELRRNEAARPRDHDGLEAALCALAGDRDFRRARAGRGKEYARGLSRAAVREAHAVLVAALEAFALAADADLAAVLQPELLESIARYEQEKAQQGALDFLDLLLRARDLIRDCDEVRADFQRRFTHLFIDEFQDTDPLQAEILLLLGAADPAQRDFRAAAPARGKLFVVGDPKQSIYRFRRADLAAYRDATEWLIAHGALHVRLATSFRAVPSLQRFVNAAFASAMQGETLADALQASIKSAGGTAVDTDASASDGANPAYVALEPFRDEHATQPSLVALPVPRPYGRRGEIAKNAIEASLPDAIAAFVDWLLRKSGWTVTERERPGERVPIAARHVCLLFRRFDSFYSGDVTRGYVRALEARNVPHLLVGGRSFHAREEIETLRAALCAIEWPDDTLSVFACLRGTLFAIDDELLLQYTHAHGALHPLRVAQGLAPALQPIADALAQLAALHRGRNRRSVAETIALLLEATRAHAGFALRPAGEQVLANVLHLAELARGYELTGGLSFRAFVERLLDEAESRRTAEAPILEEGSDGVRLMTAFKAKGLEFPVVILADITARPSGQADRYVDAARGLCALRIAGWTPAELHEHADDEQRLDQAEGLRVAYVAATRARDLLVVPAVGDEPFAAGWISSLNPALHPEPLRARDSEPAPGCPAFGSDSTLDRGGMCNVPDNSGVRPGVHRMPGTTGGTAAYEVVWWDPRALELDAAPRQGIRRTDLIRKDAPQAQVDADLAVFHAWATERGAALDHGAQPSVRARTATAHAVLRSEAGEAVARAVELVSIERAADRPRGKRFGALVHALFATAPLDAPAELIAAVAEQQGRVLAALPEEVSAAGRAAATALAHPLMRRAAQAMARGQCRRETPVTLRDPDGAWLEGVVDLAFFEPADAGTAEGRWTVIDFKTDHDIAHGLDAYRHQVALYADAITAATGQAAQAVLLLV